MSDVDVFLPPDGHVHSEWSWDAVAGSMEHSCARASAVGLPAIAFTEHVDHTVWQVDPEDLEALPPDNGLVTTSDSDGQIKPPPFDVEGYFECIDRCRDLFPDLTVLTGVEVGEPHWYADTVGSVLGAGTFDRVLGSLHCLPDGDLFREPPGLYRHRHPDEVVREYLLEVAVLVANSDAFAVLAHLDYPVRSWPSEHGPFDPMDFEDEFRHALRATAQSGRALEINTRVPLDATVLGWWRDEGGDAVSFGSDAHDPLAVGRGLADAAGMAEAHGYRPSRNPLDLWPRTA